MTSESMPDFTEKLNTLFRTHTKPGGVPYTNDEVGKASGLTNAALSKLRTGKSKNPSMDTIAKLAHFFEVPPGYFFDDGDQSHIDPYLNKVALRASRLGPESKQALLDMLEHILKLEDKQDE